METQKRILVLGSADIAGNLQGACGPRCQIDSFSSLDEAKDNASTIPYSAVIAVDHAPAGSLPALNASAPIIVLSSDGADPAANGRCSRRNTYVPLSGQPWSYIAGVVTAVIRADEAEKENLLLRRVLEHAPDCLIGLDDAGRICLANAPVTQVFGYPRNEVIGRPLVMLFPPATQDLTGEDMTEAAKAGLPWKGEVAARKADGAEFPMHVTISSARAPDGRLLNTVILARELTQQQQLLGRLKQLTITDELTKVYNVRYFWSRLRHEIIRSRRYQQPCSCLMCDLDHFKSVNDVYGHDCGDKVLWHIAQTIKSMTREVDVVARYGGEEFVVILPNTDMRGAFACAEHIRRKTEITPLPVGDTSICITISIGVASLSREVDNEETFQRQADQALLRAKQDGRNRVCIHDASTAPSQQKCPTSLIQE